MTKKSVLSSVKTIILRSVIGVVAALLVSLAGGAVAMKTADPLKAVQTVALLCVAVGAFVAAFFAAKAEKGLAAGFAAGGFYVLFLLLASLSFEGGGTSPLLLLISALVGTALGAFVAKGRKPSTAKRLKRLAAGKPLR